MAYTLAEHIEIVRSILQDQRAPYRYNNLELCRYLAEAVTETRRKRPDLMVYSLDAKPILFTDSNLQAVVDVPDFLFTPINNYVAGRAEMRDDSYTTDGRAVALMNLFSNALKDGA